MTSSTSRAGRRSRDSWALGPDGLFPVGEYPGNDDDGRTLQAGLDQAKLRTDMANSARFLKLHALSNRKLGITGCWGGGTTNYLATVLGPDLQAAVPYYGAAAETASVPNIKAPLLIHYAEVDERINAMWPAYQTALKAASVTYTMYTYPGSTAFTTTRRRGTRRQRPSSLGSGPSRSSGRTWPEQGVVSGSGRGSSSPVARAPSPAGGWRCRLPVGNTPRLPPLDRSS